VWIRLYCIVGGQLAWMVKPFHVESGNIYVSFFSALGQVPD